MYPRVAVVLQGEVACPGPHVSLQQGLVRALVTAGSAGQRVPEQPGISIIIVIRVNNILQVYIAVSGNKMTITYIILTNQRRPYKLELQHLQQKLDKIDMSYHYRRCVIIIGGASE